MSLLELAQSNKQSLAEVSNNSSGLLGLATSVNPISKIDKLKGQLQIAKANSDYANSMRGFGINLLGGGISAIKDVGKSVLNTFKSVGEQNAQIIQKTTDIWGNPESTTAQNIAAGLNLISPAANIAFSPLIAANAAAEKLPVFKPAADFINNVFSIPGALGKFSADKFTDNLPFVSQQTKDTLRPAFEEVGSLVGQIWLGGKIIETLGVKGDIKSEDVTALKEQAKTIETPATQELPKELPSQGLRGLAETPAETPLKTPAEVSTKPVPATTKPISKSADNLPKRERINALFQQVNDTAVAGKEVANTRALTLDKAALERKLTESLSELPTHNRMDMSKETGQAGFAADFVDKNYEQTLRILNHEALPPSHILPESIYTAAEIKYVRTGDETLRQALINSKIPTLAGRAFKALDSNDPDSPIKIMRDIQAAREEKVTPKMKQSIVNDVKTEIKKSASARPTWEQFIAEIKCNY